MVHETKLLDVKFYVGISLKSICCTFEDKLFTAFLTVDIFFTSGRSDNIYRCKDIQSKM